MFVCDLIQRKNKLIYFFKGWINDYCLDITYQFLQNSIIVSFEGYKIVNKNEFHSTNIKKFKDFILQFLIEKNIEIAVFNERFNPLDRFLIETTDKVFIYDINAFKNNIN